MKKIISLCPFIFLLCCSVKDGEVKLTLKNQTIHLIDSVRISTYGVNEVFKLIKPSDSISKSISFSYKGKYEGAWTILIYTNSELKGKGSFGYYSNSSDIKKSYTVTVYNNFAYKEN